MKIVCLDMEGVLVPEIWIEFSKRSGIPELSRTTRDEPDYDKLMRFRIGLLRERGLKLADIQHVILGMGPPARARADAAGTTKKHPQKQQQGGSGSSQQHTRRGDLWRGPGTGHKTNGGQRGP